jgi:hypothetical protein
MIFEPAIDRRTEEKMLRGTLPPEDAPPELARVAVLLRAASAPRGGDASGSTISEIDPVRMERMVASMAAIITAGAPSGTAAAAYWKAQQVPALSRAVTEPWTPRRRALGRTRMVLAMTLGLMVASAGLAFAGVLPSPVQHAASVVLSKVGIHVPDDGHAPTPPTHDGAGNDQGNGKDNGNHNGQTKNGNNGKHKGQEKNGNNGDNGKHKGKGGSDDGDEGDGSGSSGHGSSHGDGGSSGSSGSSGHSGGHSGHGGDHDGSSHGHDGGHDRG